MVCDLQQGWLGAGMADSLVFFKEFFNHEDWNDLIFIKRLQEYYAAKPRDSSLWAVIVNILNEETLTYIR